MREAVYLALIRGITWSCPKCGRPFLTEQAMVVHFLQCGS